MIVSFNKKFIWIKGRKAASSSIEIALNKLCGEGDIYNKLNEHKEVQNSLKVPFSTMIEGRQYGLKPHAKARGIKSKLQKNGLLRNEQWNSFFKFTVDRHPIDKVGSLYYYLLNKNPKKYKSFDHYMKSGDWKKCYNFPLYTDGNDNVIVDFIILYEALESDLDIVRRELKEEIKLFKENTHQRKRIIKNYDELFTKEHRGMIKKTFRKEIELHQYDV